MNNKKIKFRQLAGTFSLQIALLLVAVIASMPVLIMAQSNPQPAILGSAGSSNRAIVFPDPGSNPANQMLVPGLPDNAIPHGVAYFGNNNALISDFLNSRIFVIEISTATLLSTINTAGTFDGTGNIAVSPNLQAALAIGGNNVLTVIRAPFNSGSSINSLTLPGLVDAFQTQGIVFDNTGRAFVSHRGGVSVLDPPYTSIAFTIPVTPVPFELRSGSIAVTPSGNQILVTTIRDNMIRIYNAPYSASSTPVLLTVPGLDRLYGINITPDGQTAIVVNSNFAGPLARFIHAPFDANSVVEAVPMPPGLGTAGFEDVGISADGEIAVLTGNGGSGASDQLVFIRAPFTSAGTSTSLVPVVGVVNPGRGNGAIRFLPPGLAPGLTIEKSAAASVPSGSDLTYTITYGNTGQIDANNVVISDPLPVGTTFVSADNGGALVSGSVVFNVGAVVAGATGLTVSFTVNVNAAEGESVDNNNYTIAATGVTPIAGPPVTTQVGAAVCPEISLNPATLPNGMVGAAYDQSVTASGGTEPYSFAVTSGALPNGLALSASGAITGTPIQSGSFSFTFEAIDASECAGSREYSINVDAAPTPTPTPTPPPSEECPKGQGYWRNNPSAWPVDELELGGVMYTKDELIDILTTPVGGRGGSDASLILASQLIAAKLNVANGVDPGPVESAIAQADELLASVPGRIPKAIKPASSIGNQMTQVAGILDSYNNGHLTPGCAEEVHKTVQKTGGFLASLRNVLLESFYGVRMLE